jgi:hypothetical protein
MWEKTFFASFVAQVPTTLGFSFATPFLPFFISELGIRDIGQQGHSCQAPFLGHMG